MYLGWECFLRFSLVCYRAYRARVVSVGNAGGFPLRVDSVGARVEGGFISSGIVSFDFLECVRGFQGDRVCVGGAVGFLRRAEIVSVGVIWCRSLGDVFF